MKISIKTTLIITLSCMILGYLYSNLSYKTRYVNLKIVEKIIIGKDVPHCYILFEEEGKIKQVRVSSKDYIYYQKDSIYKKEIKELVWN